MFLLLPSAYLVNPVKYGMASDTCASGAALCYRKNIDDLEAQEIEEFVQKRIKMGHESVIEHASFSAMILTNRGVTHELVRHRLASFTQESTRFTNYEKTDNGVSFIIPPKLRVHVRAGEWTLQDVEDFRLRADVPEETMDWVYDMFMAEHSYMRALSRGWAPEEARCYLNNATATRILMTANMREWRHVFNLRFKGITGRPHPEIKEVIGTLYDAAVQRYPIFFE